MVVEQLRAGGVLEAVRIACAGAGPPSPHAHTACAAFRSDRLLFPRGLQILPMHLVTLKPFSDASLSAAHHNTFHSLVRDAPVHVFYITTLTNSCTYIRTTSGVPLPYHDRSSPESSISLPC